MLILHRNVIYSAHVYPILFKYSAIQQICSEMCWWTVKCLALLDRVWQLFKCCHSVISLTRLSSSQATLYHPVLHLTAPSVSLCLPLFPLPRCLVSIISSLETSAWLVFITGGCIADDYCLSVGLLTSLCHSVVVFDSHFIKLLWPTAASESFWLWDITYQQ